MPALEIPDPSLVVLMGPAGSGKSTFAARHFAPDEVLSSDALRAVVSGDAADQRATKPAFALLQRILEQRLRQGKLTVVDATNLTQRARRPLVASAHRAGMPAVAIVLDLPGAIVHARNAARIERVVDPAVVDRHLSAIRHALDGDRLRAEGFDEVAVLRSPEEIDAIDIERRQLGDSPRELREPRP